MSHDCYVCQYVYNFNDHLFVQMGISTATNYNKLPAPRFECQLTWTDLHLAPLGSNECCVSSRHVERNSVVFLEKKHGRKNPYKVGPEPSYDML